MDRVRVATLVRRGKPVDEMVKVQPISETPYRTTTRYDCADLSRPRTRAEKSLLQMVVY